MIKSGAMSAPRRPPLGAKTGHWRWEVHALYPGFVGIVEGHVHSAALADSLVQGIVAQHGEGAAWAIGPMWQHT